jgi:hypothetical protein
VVNTQFKELGFVKEGRDEATQAGGINVIICTRVRRKKGAEGEQKINKKQNANNTRPTAHDAAQNHRQKTNQKSISLSLTYEIQMLKRREVRQSPRKRRASGVADLVPCGM